MSCKHCEHGHEAHTHTHTHTHEHHHDHGAERGLGAYLLMGLSAVLLLLAIFAVEGTARLVLCVVAYLAVGWPVLKEAGENILHGRVFDENFLMSVASLGAFCIGEYPEAAAVMLLYCIGETLQDLAVDRSRRSIEALVNVRPDRATLADGSQVDAAAVAVGDKIVVRPGERIPLDGVVCAGQGSVDTSALTGESLPRPCALGDTVLAGCVALDSVLTVEVTKPFGESSVSRILALVEDAQENKAQPERFITRFSRVYTPVVCALAVVVALVPPLLGWGTWSSFIHKALSFLVISCPCALVISVPLSYFSGIGCASHHGVLFKGGNYLEGISKAHMAAFDKTGTLTCGSFRVVELTPAEGASQEELLETAAYCESRSTHPLARCIVEAYESAIDPERMADIREISGYGVEAKIDGKTCRAGKRAFMEAGGIPLERKAATCVYVSREGQYLGCIALADTLKPDSKKAIAALRDLGFTELCMLSGDRQEIADEIAGEIGLDHAFGQLLPEDKVTRLLELKRKGAILYTGDGINDAPVLAAADVGIAMGGLGSDAAMEAADVVIMSDEPSRIPLAVRIARKTMRIARENIALSLLIKVSILILSVVADVGLWLAVFADVGVCMIAIANSLRALYIKELN